MPERPARRVLFVHYGGDEIRGSERCLLDLLGSLDRQKFEPVVWCNAAITEAAVRALRIPVARSDFAILLGWAPPRWRVGAWLSLIRQGVRLIRQHGVQLVHANSGAPNQWMVPAARRCGVPVLAHLHARYLFRDRCTLLLHQVSLAVGVSGHCVHGLLEDGMARDRTAVIPNGIDPDRTAAGDATQLRASLGIEPAALVVTAAGSLIERKGLDVAIRAMALLRKQHSAHLLIVGEGPRRAALEELADATGGRSWVHFLGEREHVGAVFRDATDVALLASREEAFGLVLAEAGLFGVPAVASRVGGIPDVIVDGESGLLVPPEDPPALARALERLTLPEERRRLGQEAKRLVFARFTAARMARSFEAAYEALLAARARGNGSSPNWNMRPWLRGLARRLRPSRTRALSGLSFRS